MLVELELRQIIRGPEFSAVIVLGEKADANREFPIYIDQFQAGALEMAIRGIEADRPLTHDLVVNVIRDMGGTLRRVIIDKLALVDMRETFFAKLDVEMADHSSTWIDARSSDAVVLSSKLHVPIYADEEVLKAVNAKPSPDGPDFSDLPDLPDDL